VSPTGAFLLTFGQLGHADGEFGSVTGVAAGRFDRVLVADPDNSRAQMFDGSGRFLLAWGSMGSGDGEFAGVKSFATSADGYIYVVDQGNERVQEFEEHEVAVRATSWSGVKSQFRH